MPTPTLITGAGGLLGFALRKLCPDAPGVASSDYDLTSLPDTKTLFQKYQPEKVIHLAAKVGGVKTNALKNADFYTKNVQINTNVLSVACENGVKRLVSVLSACAFPTFPDRPTTEEDLHSGIPFTGNLGYGISKRMLDIHTQLLWKQYGCQFSTITPVTLYGPNDNWDMDEGHVVGALIHKCYRAKKESKPFEIWGSGNAIRQFIYSLDVARILLRTLDFFHGPDTFMIAPDEGISVRTLAFEIAQVMEFHGSIVFDSSKPEGQLRRQVQSHKFANIFPHFEFTPLQEGLRETVRWFLENFEGGTPTIDRTWVNPASHGIQVRK